MGVQCVWSILENSDSLHSSRASITRSKSLVKGAMLTAARAIPLSLPTKTSRLDLFRLFPTGIRHTINDGLLEDFMRCFYSLLLE